MNKENLKPSSLLNHDSSKDQFGAIVPPIYQNSLFAFENWDAIDRAFDRKNEDYIYSRLLNPTARIVEDKLAALAGGEKAKLCASGIAAITSAVLHCVNAGDHILTINKIYGPTNTFIKNYLSDKFNITSSFIDGRNLDELKIILKKTPDSFT